MAYNRAYGPVSSPGTSVQNRTWKDGPTVIPVLPGEPNPEGDAVGPLLCLMATTVCGESTLWYIYNVMKKCTRSYKDSWYLNGQASGIKGDRLPITHVRDTG